MGFLSAIGGIVGNIIAPGVGGAVGSGLGSLGDSLIAGNASKGAASTQAAGADAATALQSQIYNQNRTDRLPWLKTGQTANDELAYLMGLSPSNPNSASSNPFDGQQLVTSVGGVPTVNSQLYASSPEYKAAWDQILAQHQSTYGTGYTQKSDLNSLNNALTAKLQPVIDAQKAQATTAAQNDPQYGSLAKPFSLSDFTADPGYQFRLDQGQKALERSAAAKGGLMSGAALKATTDFAQGTAAQEYQSAYDRYNTNQNNLYSRLSGLSNSGQGMANTGAQAGASYANNASAPIQDAAQIRATGQANNANAWSTGLGNLASSFMGGSSGGSGYAAYSPDANFNPFGVIWN